MSPSLVNIVIVLTQVAVILVVGLRYLDRLRIPRPPVGTYNRTDVGFMLAVLVLLPPLYLALPRWALVAVFALFLVVVLHYTLAPALPNKLPLAIAVALVAGDVALFEAVGAASPAFYAINDVVLAVAVVGVCNLYVQTGMRAEHVALFAGVLTIYDYVATIATSLMSEFLVEMGSIPLAPMLAWGGPEKGIGIGLGDLLVLLLWTLAAHKAYGRAASLVAAATGLATVAVITALFWLDVFNSAVPVMVVLGPAVVAQQVRWRRRFRERTVHQWRLGLPPASAASAPDSATDAGVGPAVASWSAT